MEQATERACWICGRPVNEGDVVLPGLGGDRADAAVLYIHAEDCAGEFLLYLKQLTWPPGDRPTVP